MNIHLKTFGCTYNHADTDAIVSALEKAGHCIVPEDNAEVVILNTCAVKDATEKKQLHRIEFEKKKLIVTGCLAQNAANSIQNANPSAAVVGTFSQGRILEALFCLSSGKKVQFLGRSPDLAQSTASSGVVGRIKISKGCLSSCSFCQTKRARGHLQSFSKSEIRRLVREKLASGSSEIQLTSQDCGCYGFENKTNAADLLVALSGLGGDYRIRLGMGNPEHFRLFFDALLDAMAHENIYKFLHIPVQSGSNSVLLDMKRPYVAETFIDLARRFRQRFSDGLLATDIIVGYPTESKNDFDETQKLIRLTRPDFVNVSKFSPRPGTPAAKLAVLNNHVVKQRSQACSLLSRRIASENNQAFVGKKMDVLAVEPADQNGILCRSDCYRPVILNAATLGQRYQIRATSAGAGFLKAEILYHEAPIAFGVKS